MLLAFSSAALQFLDLFGHCIVPEFPKHKHKHTVSQLFLRWLPYFDPFLVSQDGLMYANIHTFRCCGLDRELDLETDPPAVNSMV